MTEPPGHMFEPLDGGCAGEVGITDTAARRTARAGSAPDRRRSLPYLPGLDGLRGLAVLAVVLYHVGVTSDLGTVSRFTRGGALGVSAFFTLSGYLICSLLLVEHDRRGFISLGGFWSRRLRRLMPAALATLGAVVLLTPLLGTGTQLRELPGQVIAALAYGFNWWQIWSGNDYAANFTQPSPLTHFWSLAVEEQAYVFLPLVVAFALRHRRSHRSLVVVFGGIAAASVTATIILGGGQYSNRVYLGTDTRIGEIAIGALLAVLIAARDGGRSLESIGPSGAGPTPVRWLGPVSGVASLAVLAGWIALPITHSWLYRGGLIVHAVAIASVIAAIRTGRFPFERVLAARPLVALGKVSYGVYLFHWPVMLWATAARLGVNAWAAVAVQLLLVVGLAAVSHVVLETPIRSGHRVRGSRRIWIPLAAIAAVTIGALALPEPDASQVVALQARGEAIIASTTAPSTPPTPEAGPANASEAGVPIPDDPNDPNDNDPSAAVVADTVASTAVPLSPVRVLITGDSFGLSLGVGFERLAERGAPVSAYNRGLVGCGFGRGGRNRGIGKTDVWPDYCVTRQRMMDEDVASFAPDVILASGGLWDITDRQLAGSGRWTHVGEPDYDAFLIAELRARYDEWSGYGARVVWTTIPTFDPVYYPENHMGRPPYAEAEAGRSQRFNELLYAAMAERPDAVIIDLAQWMREYPGGEYSPALRTDGVHFLESSAVEAAQWLLPQIEAVRPTR